MTTYSNSTITISCAHLLSLSLYFCSHCYLFIYFSDEGLLYQFLIFICQNANFFFFSNLVFNATFKHIFLVSLKQLLSLPFFRSLSFPLSLGTYLKVEIVFYWIEYRISALSSFVISGAHINLSLSQLPHL